MPNALYVLFDMWRILESKAARKVLDKAPTEITKKWALWLSIVEHDGPEGLTRIPGFHDEALQGEHQGHRSSRLNDRCRVIYRVTREELLVSVVEVTRSHKY